MKTAVLALALILVVASLTISKLVHQQRAGHEPWVDPELRPAVDEWKRDLAGAGIGWHRAWAGLDSIVIGPAGEGLAGHSDRWSSKVVIGRQVVDRGETVTRGIVYHELGHAVFRLPHGGDGVMRAKIHSHAGYVLAWPRMLSEYISSCQTYQSNAQ